MSSRVAGVQQGGASDWSLDGVEGGIDDRMRECATSRRV